MTLYLNEQNFRARDKNFARFFYNFVRENVAIKNKSRSKALMTPNRILPNYNLFKLYQKSGDKEKTLFMANRILSQHIKIDNTQTIRIQFEVENYLKSIQ
jgi:hypothetical protein